MFRKSSSFLALGIAGLLCVLLVIFQPVPQFNYDFEQFFPQDDPDLDFYEEFIKVFENDNDYLLIAIQNPDGELADPAFLDEILEVQQEIQRFEKVDTVISILNLEKPIIGLFGWRMVKVLDWNDSVPSQSLTENLDKYRSTLISKDGKGLLLWIKNEQKISKEEGDFLYLVIKGVFERNGITPVAVAGKIQAQGDFVNLMQKEFGLFMGFSILLMIGMLALIYRSWWGVVVPISVLVIGIAWAFGIILFSGKALDVMSVMQPTIFLIVGLSAIIHFITHLTKLMKSGMLKDAAIEQVFLELWIPVLLTVLTTSFGFFSLYFTSIPALQEFGLTTGIGVLVMFVSVILITPGLLYLIPVKVRKGNSESSDVSKLRVLLSLIFHHRKLVIASFIGLTLIAVVLASGLKVNGYLLDNLPQDHPIQKDFVYFDEQFGGSNPLELSISVGQDAKSLLDLEVLKEIEKVEKKVSELFGGGQIISPLTLIKTLNQAQNQGDERVYKLPTAGQYQRMKRYLTPAQRQLDLKVISENRVDGRISARAADLGSLEMGKRRAFLDMFVEKEINPGLLKVRWTGTAYLIDRGHQSVSEQMAKGLGVAFVLVGIIAGFLFRSWRISLIMLIPNIIPLVWMLGLMYLLGIDFKLTTAILFTVAFGIAVDDTIHFMTRLRLELNTGKNLLYAIKRTFLETGKAIILTSVILVCGFGLLIFSQFGVTHFTGLLISSSLVFALLADLILLPLLLLPMRKVWEKKYRK